MRKIWEKRIGSTVNQILNISYVDNFNQLLLNFAKNENPKPTLGDHREINEIHGLPLSLSSINICLSRRYLYGFVLPLMRLWRSGDPLIVLARFVSPPLADQSRLASPRRSVSSRCLIVSSARLLSRLGDLLHSLFLRVYTTILWSWSYRESVSVPYTTTTSGQYHRYIIEARHEKSIAI